MLNIIKFLKFKKEPPNCGAVILEKQNMELFKEIKDVCSEMAKTENWFQTESNSDLIEACIYQKEFLNSKYRYLINMVKTNNEKLASIK